MAAGQPVSCFLFVLAQAVMMIDTLTQIALDDFYLALSAGSLTRTVPVYIYAGFHCRLQNSIAGFRFTSYVLW